MVRNSRRSRLGRSFQKPTKIDYPSKRNKTFNPKTRNPETLRRKLDLDQFEQRFVLVTLVFEFKVKYRIENDSNDLKGGGAEKDDVPVLMSRIEDETGEVHANDSGNGAKGVDHTVRGNQKRTGFGKR